MKTEVEIPPLTPAQLAGLFWEMDAKQQGLFFDELGTLVMSTPTPFTRQIGSMFGLDMQLYAASQECTALGQDVMRRFYENGHCYLKPEHA